MVFVLQNVYFGTYIILGFASWFRQPWFAHTHNLFYGRLQKKFVGPARSINVLYSTNFPTDDSSVDGTRYVTIMNGMDLNIHMCPYCCRNTEFHCVGTHDDRPLFSFCRYFSVQRGCSNLYSHLIALLETSVQCD